MRVKANLMSNNPRLGNILSKQTIFGGIPHNGSKIQTILILCILINYTMLY